MTIQNGSKVFCDTVGSKIHLLVDISLFYEAILIIFSMLVFKISIRKNRAAYLSQVNHVLSTRAK